MSATSIALRVVVVALAAGAVAPGVAYGQGAADAYFEFLMARRLESAGRVDDALAALQRAERADPGSAEIKAEIAALQLRRNPPARDEGEAAAKAALAIDPDNVEANRALGFLYAGMVDGGERALSAQMNRYLTDAIAHLERAAAGMPAGDANLLYTLGRLYMRGGDPAKAVGVLSQVVRQNPSSLPALRSLAQAHAAVGNLQAAVRTLEDVVEFLPGVAAELGLYQEQLGNFREAAAAYTIALAVNSNNRVLKLSRIRVLYNAKEFAQAAALAAAARKEHPDDVRFPQLQARALFDAGDRSGGIAVAEAAARAFPKEPQAQWALVEIYGDAGRTSDVEKVLRQILAADPTDANALNHLGYLLAVRGEQLDEAISLVRRALDRDPDNGAYLDSLGWAYFRRGDLPEAQKYLTAAAEKLPGNSEIQDHLGDVHARRGQFQEAIAAWTRALDGDGSDVDRDAIAAKISDAKNKMQNAR